MDMRGPKTLEGGYSPSQYVSSALKANDDCSAETLGIKATEDELVAERIWDEGAKAETAATIKERTTKLSLVILMKVVCRRKEGIIQL